MSIIWSRQRRFTIARRAKSAVERVQLQLMAASEPERAIAVVAQFIARVRVHEHVEHAVIEGKPAHEFGEFSGCELVLITPHRMRPDRSLVEAPHLRTALETHRSHLA